MEIKEYLRSVGFPDNIVSRGKEDLSSELLEKLSLWKIAVNRDRPVTVVTGPRSHHKDILIMLMAREFAKIGKSVWVVDDIESETLPQAFLIVLMMVELQSPKAIPTACSWLARHIFQGKALILETESLTVLRQKCGEAFFNLIDSRKIQVDVPKPEVAPLIV